LPISLFFSDLEGGGDSDEMHSPARHRTLVPPTAGAFAEAEAPQARKANRM